MWTVRKLCKASMKNRPRLSDFQRPVSFKRTAPISFRGQEKDRDAQLAFKHVSD